MPVIMMEEVSDGKKTKRVGHPVKLLDSLTMTVDGEKIFDLPAGTEGRIARIALTDVPGPGSERVLAVEFEGQVDWFFLTLDEVA